MFPFTTKMTTLNVNIMSLYHQIQMRDQDSVIALCHRVLTQMTKLSKEFGEEKTMIWHVFHVQTWTEVKRLIG